MMGWVFLGFYAVGYVLMWRTVTWAILNDIAFGRPDAVDVTMSCLLGSVLTGGWPLVLAGLGVRAVYRHRGIDASQALMPRRVRRVNALSVRERRIAAMERELGIGR